MIDRLTRGSRRAYSGECGGKLPHRWGSLRGRRGPSNLHSAPVAPIRAREESSVRAHIGRIAALLLVAVSTSCGVFIARPRADQDIITREVIDQHRFLTAFEAVQALHSNWLISRPKTFGVSPGDAGKQPSVAVYLDENRLPNGIDELKDIESQRIQYIRYYDPISATQKWGVGHTEGAIQVSTQPM